MQPQTHEEIVHEAIKDVTSIYETPQDVVSDTRISKEEKLKILENWELDEQRLIESAAENMPPDHEHQNEAPELLQEIMKAKQKV